jgi:2-oxoglutarate dehydrogenase complex dehydrogenase (E1) component-like enzyme
MTTEQTSHPEKKQINWTQIENDYRAGIKTLRQIAEENDISNVAILKRAKRDDWTRDLTARIQAKADAKVSKALVSSEVSKERAANEREIVEANAELQYQIRISHRKDIQRVKALLMSLLGEAESQSDDRALYRQLGELLASPDEDGNVDKLNEIYKKAMSLPQRVTVVKQVTETLATLIKLEREAFGIDKEEKASGGYESLLKELAKAAAEQ